MTPDVVSVNPDMPVREIARVLLEKRISAVPVVDERGAPVGMVSEGDLVGRGEAEREARRDWWLALLAEGDALNADFLASISPGRRTAREVMTMPVVAVSEDTDIAEIARLLAAHRIKRVPVLHDERMVGIVSRANLLCALAEKEAPPTAIQSGGFLAGALAKLDDRFLHHRQSEAPSAPTKSASELSSAGLGASDFRQLVVDFEDRKLQQREEALRIAAEQRRRRVAELIDHHISDQGWRGLLQEAREAAEHGRKEFMLLRFPSQLCSDGGRAINVEEPNWPATLRGEAAEMYLRWEHDLKPRGFHLVARILEFPDGVPGDVGFILAWG